MNILLMITVCKMNSERIVNQIENIKRNQKFFEEFNIQPLFVTGDVDLNIKGYQTLYLNNFEEKYTNLARKIVYALTEISKKFNYDYIIKMDDDTMFNASELDADVFNYDYVGRFFEKFTQNELVIKLPSYNVEETIKIYPAAFRDIPFEYAAGNFYILSKKAVDIVISNVHLLENFYKENVRISEDQFVGFCLHETNVTKWNYKYETEETEKFVLQLTKHLTSLHPITNTLFMELLTYPPKQQLEKLLKNNSLMRRKVLLQGLKDNLKQVIFDFVNSKKLSGMG